MNMSNEACYQALLSHDARFDGVFFTCVSTTGIYCRPVCPTAPPKAANCTFVTSAAIAEKHGYRPCLRCRPELAPLSGAADNTPAHMLRKHIEDTLLMDETLAEIAPRYDVSERHLRRSFTEAFGVGPKEYALTRRLLFAKQLLQETSLPVIDVAYTAGFNTPARLTATMREAYGFTPSQLRAKTTMATSASLVLRAPYRPPFDWSALLHVLAGRATPLEHVDNDTYYRILPNGTITVANDPAKNQLLVTIPSELSHQAYRIMQSVRQLFDLDADPLAIHDSLRADPRMRALLERYPGIRIPGAWDKFELLIRVIVGQQVSVAGATTIMRRIVSNIGITPEVLAASTPAHIAQMGMPLARATTIHTVSTMVYTGALDLEERNPTTFYEQLVAISGIGPWTAEYLCMRVLHWPDSFPAGDLGIQKALGADGTKLSETAARTQSQAWRPWRSYATMLLWRSIANQGG